MPKITTSDSYKDQPVELYYEDYGQGQPIVLIHGWPLSGKMFEGQVGALVDAGYRVITYDRRGFGSSARPWNGYDYDRLSTDLRDLLNELDLQNAVILGFSMGGGEVARYCAKFGGERLAGAALVSSVVPIVKKTDDNPDGVPQDAFDEIMNGLKTDRVGFLKEFGKDFYNYKGGLMSVAGNDVSEAHLHYEWSIMSHASPRATKQCAYSWYETDFRADARQMNVPTLIVHGDADKVVPQATAGDQATQLIPNNRYEVIEGAPHGLVATHREEFNTLLLDWLRTLRKPSGRDAVSTGTARDIGQKTPRV